MQTPTLKVFFNALSTWINTHKTLLTIMFVCFTSAATFAANQFLLKDDYEKDNKQILEVLKQHNSEISQQRVEVERERKVNQLQDANWEIDSYLRQGEDNLNDYEKERLDRARKKRDAIESEIRQ